MTKGAWAGSFGSYLAHHGLDGAVGYFRSAQDAAANCSLNRRTANRLRDQTPARPPIARGHVAVLLLRRDSRVADATAKNWPSCAPPAMEMEEGQVKQVLEEKEGPGCPIGVARQTCSMHS